MGGEISTAFSPTNDARVIRVHTATLVQIKFVFLEVLNAQTSYQ
jgi:hypothetical protein